MIFIHAPQVGPPSFMFARKIYASFMLGVMAPMSSMPCEAVIYISLCKVDHAYRPGDGPVSFTCSVKWSLLHLTYTLKGADYLRRGVHDTLTPRELIPFLDVFVSHFPLRC